MSSVPFTNQLASQFETKLDPAEEMQFQIWKGLYAPRDSGIDYDFRGAFKEGLKPDPQSGHWPDTYKKPNHPTFSVQSKYASGNNAIFAGDWDKNDEYVQPALKYNGYYKEGK